MANAKLGRPNPFRVTQSASITPARSSEAHWGTITSPVWMAMKVASVLSLTWSFEQR